MTNNQKIRLADFLINEVSKVAQEEDIPVFIGVLNTVQGIKGFKLADVGRPVFEFKDKYIIYFESDTPLLYKQDGKQIEIKDFKVEVSYYKESLSKVINFNNHLYNE